MALKCFNPSSLQLNLLLLSFSVIALELIRCILSDVLDKVVNFSAPVVARNLLGALGQPVEVGKPLTSNWGGTSLAVASIFTISTSSSDIFSPSSSNTGVSFLQWPHQGA